MRYAALAPGKRLRPCLVLAACEAVGGDTAHALNAACAVELVHAFSLVHDDLPAIDDDDLRRGRPTCHVQFGEATAILAGDALFALAFDVMARSPITPDRTVQATLALAHSAGCEGLVAGEIADVLLEGKPFTAEQLEFVHTRKTGALIAACCEIGALCGGAPAPLVSALRAFGAKVGLAFQIADDLLNEASDAETLGKATGSDRARGKATYPALFGIEGSREMASTLVRDALNGLPDVPDAGVLRYLAQFAIERKS